MSDGLNSPNDPLFFMHHCAIDYLWALWQEQDFKRLQDYGDAHNGIMEGHHYNGNTPVYTGIFAPDRTVKELGDTQNRDGNGILCFKYEGLPMDAYLS